MPSFPIEQQRVWKGTYKAAALAALAAIATAAGRPAAAEGVSVTQRPIFLPKPPQAATSEDAPVCSDPQVEGDAFGFALPGPVLTDDGDKAWVASFVVPMWRGELNRVKLDKDDSDQTNMNHDIPAPSDRDIITFNPSTLEGVPFKWNDLTREQKEALKTPDLEDLENDGQARLSYLRGDHSNEEDNGGPLRDRLDDTGETWRLGDTVHSRPVIVGEPPFLYSESEPIASNTSVDYETFRENQENRRELVYVGANDGMLHAFDSDTGEEALAYVPAEDLKAGSGGGLMFTRGKDQQLASLIKDGDDFVISDIVDNGNKDTKHIEATSPATADFDDNGEYDIAYLKNQSTIRVLDGGSESASTKIKLEGEKARDQKTRLTVGSFGSNDPRIFYVNEDEERIMYLDKSGGDWSSPKVAADVGDNNGANAISGFGDIDGDGRKELVYADASQDPRFLEKCDMAYTDPCDTSVQPGQRHFWKPGGTPGSNEGIGYGDLLNYDGDARDTKGLLVTDGSNNTWIYYPKEQADSDVETEEGAKFEPSTPDTKPHTVVQKGTQITDCGSKEAEGHCASKSPLTSHDLDGDGTQEIVFPAQGEDVENNLVELRRCDPSGAADGCEVSTVKTSEGDSVMVRKETGVTGGESSGGSTEGATIVERLSNLTSTDYTHQYYVDGSPTYGDAYFNDSASDASGWRSVVVTPFGRGEQGVFALDVTAEAEAGDVGKLGNPDEHADKFPLWHFDDEDHPGVGNVINKVNVVRLNNGEWAVVFGNGFNSTSDDGHSSDDGEARLFIVDIETGDLIRTISTGKGAADDPNALGPVAPVDTTGDQVVDYMYAGDVQGNLWKFDVSASSVDDWETASDHADNNAVVSVTTDDGTSQPITVRPVVTPHPEPGKAGQMVYFGTGKYIQESDHSRTDEPTQTLYGIWVDGATDQTYDRLKKDADGEGLLKQEILQEDPLSDSDEEVRTVSKRDIDWSQHTGWYLDLKPKADPNRGERLVAPPQFRNGELLVNTILPQPKPRECDSTNTAWLIKLDAEDGSRLPRSAFGLDKLNGETTVSAVKTESGSSTGGGSVYQIPAGGSGIVKSENPGMVSGEIQQGLDIRDYESGGDPTGRRLWRQLR